MYKRTLASSTEEYSEVEDEIERRVALARAAAGDANLSLDLSKLGSDVRARKRSVAVAAATAAAADYEDFLMKERDQRDQDQPRAYPLPHVCTPDTNGRHGDLERSILGPSLFHAVVAAARAER